MDGLEGAGQNTAQEGFLNTNIHWMRLIAVWLPILSLLSATTSAQDQIVLRDERTGKVTEFRAFVLSWDTKQLVYTTSERQNTVNGSRVVRVSYKKSDSQTTGDEQFASGQFTQAYQSYENAIESETRDWIKSEMLARQVQCASALNRQHDALRKFFLLYQSSPRTRHFDLIPIIWDRSAADPTLASRYETWLGGQEELQSLIAASWLMTRNESVAVDRLKQLSRSEDARIAHLANAQIWRTQIVTAGLPELQRWRAAVGRMPESFQAGPRFKIALVKKRLGDSGDVAWTEQALVGLLQIPILHPRQYQLAGRALQEAHSILVAANRNEEAAIVLAELKRDFGQSTAAIGLGSRIQTLDK